MAHWSNTSYSFKISVLPAGPVVCTLPLFLMGQVSTLFVWLGVLIWLYYIVVVFILKLHPRHSGFFFRTLLTGKNKGAKNENSPLQY